MVGIDDAAGQHQRVVVGGSNLVEGLVDLYLVAPVPEVPAFNLTAPGRDDFGGGACVFQRLLRLDEFDLFEAIGRENRDLLSLQFFSHYYYSIVGDFVSRSCSSME